MYAVIRRVRFTSVDELKPRITEDFLPNVVEKLPGFIAYYFVKISEGELESVALFETREQAEKSIPVINDWSRQHLANLLIGMPEATCGEVIIIKIAKPQAFPGQMAA